MDTATETNEEIASGTNTNGSDEQAAQSTAEAKPLVLPSLEIKNFRAFKHLTVEKLGRVNLITGKNNVGKTSLLEALWLYAERGSPQSIRKVLLGRDEISSQAPNATTSYGMENEARHDLSTRFSSLFHGREWMGGYEQEITISNLDGERQRQVSLRLKNVKGASTTGALSNKAEVTSPHDNDAVDVIDVDVTPQFEFTNSKLPLPDVLNASGSYGNFLDTFPHEFVDSAGISSARQSSLWDKVALTSFEDIIEDALRLLSPTVVRVAFIPISDAPASRVPMVRMVGNSTALPLRSLGEGVNKMLGYVLSMANAADGRQCGMLLIDEIENGLHYSVLPDVWRLIFQTARRLNVQVFATTHSWDCIEAFQKAASEDDDPQSGVLVRLQNDNGEVTSTVFDERRLEFVAYNDIEVR